MTNDQLLGPLRFKGTETPPMKEGMYVFINRDDNRRYRLYIKATLAGNLISEVSELSPWTHRNVRAMPTGAWFGPFYHRDDAATFMSQFNKMPDHNAEVQGQS